MPTMTETERDRIIANARHRWVCGVVASGFHNGAHCTPDDPHGGRWGCGWHWTSSIRAEAPKD